LSFCSCVCNSLHMETKEYIYYNILKAPNDAIIMLFFSYTNMFYCSPKNRTERFQFTSCWMDYAQNLGTNSYQQIELLHLIMHWPLHRLPTTDYTCNTTILGWIRTFHIHFHWASIVPSSLKVHSQPETHSHNHLEVCTR